MANARRAAASARVLLDTGDADGACNRAYYAMLALNKLEDLRLIADYKGDPIEEEDAGSLKNP